MNQSARRTTPPRSFGLVARAALLLCLVACSGPGRPVDNGWGNRLVAAVDEAKNIGASAAQIAILEEAANSPEGLTFAHYEAAVNATLECMRDQGLTVNGPTLIRQREIDVLNYSAGAGGGQDDDAAYTVIVECEQTHGILVWSLWTNQPSTLLRRDEIFSEHMPAMITCLQDHGVGIDDGATRPEVEEAVSTLINSVSGDGGPDGPSCYEISGWEAAENEFLTGY